MFLLYVEVVLIFLFWVMLIVGGFSFCLLLDLIVKLIIKRVCKIVNIGFFIVEIFILWVFVYIDDIVIKWVNREFFVFGKMWGV